MRRLLVLTAAVSALAAAPAYAINDPVAPGEDCSASSEAIGHPALANTSPGTPPAMPPASANNPGQSQGAQGQEHSQAPEQCANAE